METRPAPAASGELQKTPFAHLLVYANDKRLTGTFEITHPDGFTASISVVGGLPSKMRTSQPVVFLGRVLVEQRFITQELHDETLAERAEKGGLHGQLLLARAAITHAQLLRALEIQLARKLVYVFSFPPESTYAFYDRYDTLFGYGGSESLSLDIHAVIWKGLNLSPPWDHVQAALTKLAPAWLQAKAGADLTRFGFEDDVQAVVNVFTKQAVAVADFTEGGGFLSGPAAQLLIYCLVITKQVDVMAAPGMMTSSLPPPRPPSVVPSQPQGAGQTPAFSGGVPSFTGAERVPSVPPGRVSSSPAMPAALRRQSTPEMLAASASTQLGRPGSGAPRAPSQPGMVAVRIPGGSSAPPSVRAVPLGRVSSRPAPAMPESSEAMPRSPSAYPAGAEIVGVPGAVRPPSAPPVAESSPRIAVALPPHRPSSHPQAGMPRPPAHAPAGTRPVRQVVPMFATGAQLAVLGTGGLFDSNSSSTSFSPTTGGPFGEDLMSALPAGAGSSAGHAGPDLPLPDPNAGAQHASAARPPPSAEMLAKRDDERRLVEQRKQEIISASEAIAGMNYFEMLGVTRGATVNDVDAAFRELAKRWHPDRLPAQLHDAREACTRVFGRLSEAHKALSDPEGRLRYEQLLADGSDSPEAQAYIVRVVEAATTFQKAEVSLKRADYVQAEALCRKSCEGDPTQADYVAMLAWLESMRPENQAAAGTYERIAMLDRAIMMNTKCERAYFYRGMLHKKVGSTPLAMDDFRQVIELNPKNVDAQREVRLFDARKQSTPGMSAAKPPDAASSAGSKISGLFGKLRKKDS